MWMFEQRGFMSIVAYDPKKDTNKQSQFRNIAKQAGTHLLVRARIKEDLDILKSVQPSLHVEEDKGADYAFRCVIPRSKFKKFLAKAVDDIDYDSHFKEVVKARSPEADGRYSAMMSIWSTMANLQPHSPWGYSGGYGGYGGYYGGGSGGYSYSGNKGKSKSSGKAGSPAVTTGSTAKYGREGTAADDRGYATLDDFKQAYLDGEMGEDAPQPGYGPKTGYVKGDKVTGYFGTGEVVAVETERKEGIDKVQVRSKKGTALTTAWYISTFCIPADLPTYIPAAEAHEDDEALDIDELYSWLKENSQKPDNFPPEAIALLTEPAWEFLTRIQEHLGREETIVSNEDMDRIYDEVTWEYAGDVLRLSLIADDKVPAKYTEQAVALAAAHLADADAGK